MKRTEETLCDMTEFREMLIDHMAENYPGVTLPAEMIERRSRLAAEAFENPRIPVAQALDDAMGILLQGLESPASETCVCERGTVPTDESYAQMDRCLRREIMALCQSELARVVRADDFEQSEEYRQLMSLLLPIAEPRGGKHSYS